MSQISRIICPIPNLNEVQRVSEKPLVPKEVRIDVPPNSLVHLTLLDPTRTDCDGVLVRMA